jgi:cytochrome b561
MFSHTHSGLLSAVLHWKFETTILLAFLIYMYSEATKYVPRKHWVRELRPSSGILSN